MKRRARGFRTVRNLTIMLYFTAAGLALSAPTEKCEEPFFSGKFAVARL